MSVSENSGTPKSSILIGFSIINHPFWGTTILGNPHMFVLEDQLWIYPQLRGIPWLNRPSGNMALFLKFSDKQNSTRKDLESMYAYLHIYIYMSQGQNKQRPI